MKIDAKYLMAIIVVVCCSSTTFGQGYNSRDTIPPKIMLTRDCQNPSFCNLVNYQVIEDNFKSAVYSIDGGDTIVTQKNGSIYCAPIQSIRKLWFKAEDVSGNKTEIVQYLYTNWGLKPPITEKINMFISPDTSEQANEYNALKTRAQRDSLIEVRLKEDWVNTIPYDVKLWNCNHFTEQLIINSINFGDSVLSGDRPLFGWYRGRNLDSLLLHGGSLIDQGKLALPIWILGVYDKLTLPDGHSMNVIITGNDLTNPDEQNRIEPQSDRMNLQSGQSNIPINCQHIMLYYSYLGKEIGEQNINYHITPVLLFKSVNGKIEFVESNPHLKDLLITKRDTTPPIVEFIKTNDPSKIAYKITEPDGDFKRAWYTINNGGKIELTEPTGTITLDNLGYEPQTVSLIAENWFRLTTRDSTTRTLSGIDGIPRNNTISIYPNPFTDQITIVDPDPLQKTVILMDMMGRVLYQTIKMGGDLTLSDPILGTVKPRMYILRVGDSKMKVVKAQRNNH